MPIEGTDLKDGEVVLPDLVGGGYFPGTTEFLQCLLKAGVPARKSKPSGNESTLHFAFFVDFPSILMTWETLKGPLLQTSLSGIKEYVLGSLKQSREALKKHGDTREVAAQFSVFVRKPDGTHVGVRYAGEGPEEFQRFQEAVDVELFEQLSKAGSPSDHTATKADKFVCHPNRETFHRPDCAHILHDVEEKLRRRELLGFATAADAVASSKRPCKHCRPPWKDKS